MSLRFHKTLYAGEAVDAAMKRFERFASFETEDDAQYWVVRVRAHKPAHQTVIERTDSDAFFAQVVTHLQTELMRS